VFLPGGTWHETFVVTERASVENRYSDTARGDRLRHKYGQDAVRLSLLREPNGHGVMLVNLGSRPVKFVLADAARPSVGRWDLITELPLAPSIDRKICAVPVSHQMTLSPGAFYLLDT
jgi:hypothetical protein